ncbi:MAG TPA: dihydrodipicolinate reductase [Anaeromyxobacteraceae bacterium]|nr:dihydrodipicolinate reductase [Anaeromyxobacteraceae bacterium]
MAERGSGIPVVVLGLGEVGRAIARSVLETPELRLVGAVDGAPDLAGKPLAEVLGAPCAGRVAREPGEALRAAEGGVMLQATTSFFERARPHIEQAVRARVSVASTCEELAYPWLKHEAAADALDRLCEKNDVAVVGTGVNPGFALDRLPAFLSQVTGAVRHVHATRVVDASARRGSLQRKIGAGLTEEEFEERSERGEVGHVGLAESAALAALGCGLAVDEVEEEMEPVLATRDRDAEVPVLEGQVAGVRQLARGFGEGREVVRLELVLAVGAEHPRDEVMLDADPPLRLHVPGGVPGDEATAWAMVHAAAALPMLRGLVTVLDLPPGR